MRIHVSSWTTAGTNINEVVAVGEYIHTYMLRQVCAIKFHHAVEQQCLVIQHAEAWIDSVWHLRCASNKIMFWFTAFVHTVDFLHCIHFLNRNLIHVPTLANGTTSKVSYGIIFVVGITEQDCPAGVTQFKKLDRLTWGKPFHQGWCHLSRWAARL